MTVQPTDGFSGSFAHGPAPFIPVTRYPSWTPEDDQAAGAASGSSFGAGVEGSADSAPSSSASGEPTRKPKRKRRPARKTAKKAKPETESSGASEESRGPEAASPEAASPEEAKAPRAKKARRRARVRSAPVADEDSVESGGDSGGHDDDESAAARKRRRRGSRGGRRRRRGDEEDGAPAIDSIPGEDDDFAATSKDREEDGEERPRAKARGKKKASRRRASTRRGAGEDEDADVEAPSGDSDEEGGSRKKRVRSRSKKAAPAKSSPKTRTKSSEEKEREAEAFRTQTIAVNAVEPEERRVAVFENDVILDFLMNAESQKTLVNDIYRGRVVNLEPAIGAAFIDFGQGRNGFLHTSDVLPLYGEGDFKLEDLLTAGLHHEEGDHDADWAEETDAFDDEQDEDGDADEGDGDHSDDEIVAEVAEIDLLDDVDPEDEEEEEEEEEEVESRGSDAGDAPRRPARGRRPRRTSKASGDDSGADAERERPARRTRKKAASSSKSEDAEIPADGESRERRPRKKRSRKKAPRAKGHNEGADSEDSESGPEEGASRKGRTRAKKSSRKKATSDRKATRGGRSSKRSDSGGGDGSRKSNRSSSRTSPGGRGGTRNGRGRQERRPQRERRPIDQLLKVGDPVVVQVTKDAIGDKGPTLTTYISMPGRYLVLMPSMARTGVSRKIPDEKERKRLKRILSSMNTPPDMGVIVRTAGVGRTKTDLQRDLDYLMGLWESFGKKLKGSRGPAPLYLESDVATRTLRDLFNRKTKEVLVDDVGVYDQMVSFAEALMPEHVDRVKKYEGDRPLFQHCGIEQDFERIFSRRVELPSGGSIVFDQAEALVAIDVNSGRTRTNSYDFEEIALKTNLEAVPEIARQIKLRDLGGIIVCDFIDMVRSNSNRAVEKSLRTELSDDRARSKLGRISQFGLLELTRQRLGPGTHKKVFMACPRCRGTGRIRTIESRAQAILRRLGGALTQKGFSKVEVRAHPEVVAYLKEDLWDWVRAMEHRTEKEIVLTGVADQSEDSVLRYLRTDGREVRPGGRRKR